MRRRPCLSGRPTVRCVSSHSALIVLTLLTSLTLFTCGALLDRTPQFQVRLQMRRAHRRVPLTEPLPDLFVGELVGDLDPAHRVEHERSLFTERLGPFDTSDTRLVRLAATALPIRFLLLADLPMVDPASG